MCGISSTACTHRIFQCRHLVVRGGANEAVPGLHLHVAPDTPARLLVLQRPVSDHFLLVGAQRRLHRNHVRLRRVPLPPHRAAGHPPRPVSKN